MPPVHTSTTACRSRRVSFTPRRFVCPKSSRRSPRRIDITEGQPPGHAMRNALIGMRIADELRLSTLDRSALFYALLLKDLGCSSNASKMAYLFGADDFLVKRHSKTIDWARAGEKMRYVWKNCAPQGSIIDKMLRLAALARSGPKGEAQDRRGACERGAGDCTPAEVSRGDGASDSGARRTLGRPRASAQFERRGDPAVGTHLLFVANGGSVFHHLWRGCGDRRCASSGEASGSIHNLSTRWPASRMRPRFGSDCTRTISSPRSSSASLLTWR